MPSIAAFGTIVSELQTQLKGRLSVAVMYPLAVAVISLAVIAEYVFDGVRIVSRWNALNSVEKALYAALAFLAYYLLSQVLSTLQPMLSRLYQGDWPIGDNISTRRQVNRWKLRHDTENSWRDLWEHIKVQSEEPRSRSGDQAMDEPVLVAENDIDKFGALNIGSTGGVSDGTSNREAVKKFLDGNVLVANRAIPKGEELRRGDFFRIPDPTWLAGMAIVTLIFPELNIPSNIQAGSIVSAIDRFTTEPTTVNPGGSLVVEVRACLQS